MEYKRDKFGRFASSSRGKKKRTAGKKKGTILNVFLLDNTGSMSSKVSATVEGFNQVLSDAAKVKGVTQVESLALFGEFGHFKVAPKVEPLTIESYRPNRSSTALWWAVVQAIEHTDKLLKDLPKDTKVILSIFTDGDNNAVHEYQANANVLVDLKKSQDWVINFIGAGDQAFILKMSNSIGIFANNTLSYANNSAGTRSAFDKMSKSRVAYTSAVADGQSVSNDGFFQD